MRQILNSKNQTYALQTALERPRILCRVEAVESVPNYPFESSWNLHDFFFPQQLLHCTFSLVLSVGLIEQVLVITPAVMFLSSAQYIIICLIICSVQHYLSASIIPSIKWG